MTWRQKRHGPGRWERPRPQGARKPVKPLNLDPTIPRRFCAACSAPSPSLLCRQCGSYRAVRELFAEVVQ